MTWKIEEEVLPVDSHGLPSSSYFLSNGEQRLRIGREPKPGKGGKYASATGGVTSWPPHTWAWLKSNVRYRAGDVVVATYPKCGTTLTEQVVLLLLNGGDASQLDPLSKNSANMHGRFGKVWPIACVRPDGECANHNGNGPEEFLPRPRSWFDALPAPRVIKTHALVEDLLGAEGGGSPLAPGAKYVVCTRNPFDACVSCYYHAWNPSKSGWPFGAWVEAWTAAAAHDGCGSWFSWHRGWHELASSELGGKQVLWVHYESFLDDPRAETRRIAKFIGVAADDALIDRVVEGSSFDAMKAAAVKAAESGGRNNTAGHLRIGKRGGWRSHFAGVEGGAEEARRLKANIEARFEAALAGSGLVYSLGEGDQLCASSSSL